MNRQYIAKYDQAEGAFARLLETVHQLRGPNGCAWDQKQTHQSLRDCLVEEACEVLDVLDRLQSAEDLQEEGLRTALEEELGDLLLQVVFHVQLASEKNYFSMENVLHRINEKLIRRHPHVFLSDHEKTASKEVALQYWEQEKQKEKSEKKSIFDGLPKTFSALKQACRTLQKASKLGFPWEEREAFKLKAESKLNQWKESFFLKKTSSQNPEDLSEDHRLLGDLLLDLCTMASWISVSTEDALRNSVGKLQKKLRYVERHTQVGHEADAFSSWEEANVLDAIEVWGLTGGVASGKSQVAQLFAASGIFVIDADEISKKLLEQKDVSEEVEKKFGVLNRSELRKLIFSDAQAKKDLEALLHPKIRKESFQYFRNAIFLKKKIVIYEASLLVETGTYQDLAGVIAVEASEDFRLQRLIQRDGISVELAKNMMKAQLSDASRRSYVNEIIKNDGSLHDLEWQVSHLIKRKKWAPSSCFDQ
jgi:tetrapyrrole methylase family protein/MazG family protein